MDRLVIKHYLDELPREILEAAYNIDIFTTHKRFMTHLDFDRDIYEKYKDKIYRPIDDDDYCANFFDFQIGSWQVVMERDKEGS